jgi:hypothetical protein
MNFVAGRIAGLSNNSVEVETEGGVKLTLPCRPEDGAQAGAPVTLGVRPEHLNAEGEGQSQIKGEVFAVERLGGETYLYVRTEGERELTVHAAGDKTVSGPFLLRVRQGFSFLKMSHGSPRTVTPTSDMGGSVSVVPFRSTLMDFVTVFTRRSSMLVQPAFMSHGSSPVRIVVSARPAATNPRHETRAVTGAVALRLMRTRPSVFPSRAGWI